MLWSLPFFSSLAAGWLCGERDGAQTSLPRQLKRRERPLLGCWAWWLTLQLSLRLPLSMLPSQAGAALTINEKLLHPPLSLSVGRWGCPLLFRRTAPSALTCQGQSLQEAGTPSPHPPASPTHVLCCELSHRLASV